MVRLVTLLFGIAFVAVGVMGFIPAFTQDGLLLGLFEVNEMHNVVHLVSGVIALLAALSFLYSKLYLRIFGIVYGVVAILGFILGGDLIVMHVNMADNVLHAVIAVVALLVGFVMA